MLQLLNVFGTKRAIRSFFFLASPLSLSLAGVQMLIWAVGAVPYKDDFFTSSLVQTGELSTQHRACRVGSLIFVFLEGCPYVNESGCFEPNPRLQGLVSALVRVGIHECRSLIGILCIALLH